MAIALAIKLNNRHLYCNVVARSTKLTAVFLVGMVDQDYNL